MKLPSNWERVSDKALSGLLSNSSGAACAAWANTTIPLTMKEENGPLPIFLFNKSRSFYPKCDLDLCLYLQPEVFPGLVGQHGKDQHGGRFFVQLVEINFGAPPLYPLGRDASDVVDQ